MGFSLCWIAVHKSNPGDVQAALGLRPTGQVGEAPEAAFSGVRMPNDWYVVISNDFCYAYRADSALKQLSAASDVVTCAVEEHVMHAESTGWFSGRQQWYVGHDASQDRWHLDVDGAPPPQFAGIRSRLEQQQRREDAVDRAIDYLFEIPVSIAVSVAGFRHNHDMPELGERPFEVLVPHSSTRPWWQRLIRQRR